MPKNLRFYVFIQMLVVLVVMNFQQLLAGLVLLEDHLNFSFVSSGILCQISTLQLSCLFVLTCFWSGHEVFGSSYLVDVF